MTDQERYKFAEYYKIKFSGEWYLPLTQNKKLVLRPKFGFGFMGSSMMPTKVILLLKILSRWKWTVKERQFDGREIIALRGYDGNSPISPTTGGTVIAIRN